VSAAQERPPTAAVVLAAGKGTRFRSARPKVLHGAAGRTLLGHVLGALSQLPVDRILVVVGHGAEDVEAEVARWCARVPMPLDTVVQVEQRGTGDALDVALRALEDDVARVLVVPGDTPLLRGDTLGRLLDADAGAAVTCLTTVVRDPAGYGRIVRDGFGALRSIVEDRDCDEMQRGISEINAGMYVFDRAVVTPLVAGLTGDNVQGEHYLTDVIAQLATLPGGAATVLAEEDEVAGVNDRIQLADAAATLRRRHLEALMRDGVSIVDPSHTYVDVDVTVGEDSVLLPGTILEGATVVGAGSRIGPASHLSDCVIGDGVVVHSTRADGARIGDGVEVGPFAHLRPGTVLEAGARVGAFVQTKNAHLGAGAKVPHLAYVGDAEVGAGANLACGTVTVNFDGRTKHRTIIEDGAFIGCGTMLVAPVTIGSGAFVAAGSTITDDVPAGALAIARARQVVKEGRAEGRLR
jgi:bifunctional UDP-N-acetylglucosamine pyrophosphorylase/glucosamine-1-phosphate N-acetyltransferase